MAVALNTPKGEGYKACCLGAHRESNPYWSIQHIIIFVTLGFMENTLYTLKNHSMSIY